MKKEKNNIKINDKQTIFMIDFTHIQNSNRVFSSGV